VRTCKPLALTVLGLVMLWSTPASSAPSIGTADGWYKWQVEGAATTLFLQQKQGKPARIRFFSPDCRITWGDLNDISEEVVDMGALSMDDSVAMLLEIVGQKELGMAVREEALFGLAQSNSDAAFEYFDQLILDQKK